MSLSLVHDYSSEEEEANPVVDSDDGSQDEREAPSKKTPSFGNYLALSNSTKSSLLPSPEDLFTEVTGPPEFLKSAATEPIRTRPPDNWQHTTDVPHTSILPDRSQPVSDLAKVAPPGAVVEAKAKPYDPLKQMSDSDYATNGSKSDTLASPGARPFVHDDAAAVPRFIAAVENSAPNAEEDKRKGSKIKDKEKNKRMKGQSSHATWKSETEMQLRQQFD